MRGSTTCRIDLVSNPDYHGNRVPKNDGVDFVFYSNLDTAYTDLLSNNLDVLDTVPPSACTTYEQDLRGRARQPADRAESRRSRSRQRLPHFSGDEGMLAPSGDLAWRSTAIRSPSRSSQGPGRLHATSPAPHAAGLQRLDLPATATWSSTRTQAKAAVGAGRRDRSVESGSFAIAYNSDGGHQEWIDAAANSIRNTLGIDAVGAAVADVRADPHRGHRSHDPDGVPLRLAGRLPVAVRVPGANYQTGGSSNDGDYSNPEFDAPTARVGSAGRSDDGSRPDRPGPGDPAPGPAGIPMWDYLNAAGGSSGDVHVAITWNGLSVFENIEKA